MKKKNLKSLKLNKKMISNIRGGEMQEFDSNFASCYRETEQNNCPTDATCYSVCYHTCGPGHCID